MKNGISTFRMWWFNKMRQEDIYPTICVQCWDEALEHAVKIIEGGGTTKDVLDLREQKKEVI